MKAVKKHLNKACAWLLGLWSIYLLYSGTVYAVLTSGTVTGSEFGMLITLVSVGSKLLIWLALAGLWFATIPVPLPVMPATSKKGRR